MNRNLQCCTSNLISRSPVVAGKLVSFPGLAVGIWVFLGIERSKPLDVLSRKPVFLGSSDYEVPVPGVREEVRANGTRVCIVSERLYRAIARRNLHGFGPIT